MAYPDNPGHFLRAWREFKDLSLEAVAERVVLLAQEARHRSDDPNSRPRGMTHATLSRIERGKLPYSQKLLEMLAEIYQTEPASLIMRDPNNPNAAWSLADRVRKLPAEQLEQVAAFLTAIKAA